MSVLLIFDDAKNFISTNYTIFFKFKEYLHMNASGDLLEVFPTFSSQAGCFLFEQR